MVGNSINIKKHTHTHNLISSQPTEHSLTKLRHMKLEIQVLPLDRLQIMAGFQTSDGRVFASQQDNTWLYTT